MEDSFLKALNNCDKCRSYEELSSVFDQRVKPVLEKVLSHTLVKAVKENSVPDESSPQTARFRDALMAEENNIADDVWFFIFKSLNALLDKYSKAAATHSKKRARDSGAVSDGFTTIVTNAFILVSNKNLPRVDSMSLRWAFLKEEKKKFEASDAYVNSNSSERRKMLLHSPLSVFSERAHKHFFTAVWMHFITHGTEATLHIHLLYQLGAFVIKSLTTPLVLADYLTDCFSSGGLISILALHGLFLLMVDHGLEYPQYYDQLYSLITADTFASRHRYDLFRLLHLSLTSVRLPAYIVASVVKRVCHVALLAPAPALYFVLPFVRKMFQAHPNCLGLIHRSTKEAAVKAAVAMSVGEGEETEFAGSEEDALKAKKEAQQEIAQLFDGVDPYDPVAPLNASHALHSTLWELTALERHFLPTVPLMVSAYASTAEDKAPLKFEKSYARLFTAEVTRPIDKNHYPTVAYRPPQPTTDADLLSV